MSRRGAGVAFCFIAVILFTTRQSIYYLCAAILAASDGKMGTNILVNALSYISPPFSKTLAVVSLIVGIGYLVVAEVMDSNKK